MDVKKLILPGACFFCLKKVNHAWCADCEQDFILEIGRCPVCARKNPYNDICGACLKQPPYFHRAEILFNYQHPASHLIKAFKFKNRPELARCFAERFTENLTIKLNNNNRILPDILLPVPLHKNRQRQRGYNQSLEFAAQISKHIRIKVNSTLCSRIKNTDPQSALPMSTRKNNVKGAFCLSDETIPKHIAIVDDVITTGSTVDELARLLNKAGCETIEIWAVTRA
ncbi:MAG TPA: ComF family protein [Thiotrichaceae bacterium]|jgi:ComF family protein|nr:ComF family protein [Thiotrichaceae bacterium]HIM08174.1 ComF family protein [Gammaproteobacteria bacterium]